MSVDQLCVNTIRTLSIDAVQNANSGHPGLPMGAAAMSYALWDRHLKHNPADPKWPDRDRFVLSGGHGSMLLYSLLHLSGYDLSLDDVRSFRQWGSKTPGHPEYGEAPGVETTTGPLGQGFATAVGMAMAEAHLAARFNTGAHTVVDHYTYVLASDGDMMEGVCCEAASLAGHLRLGKLVVLYDCNGITLAGSSTLSFTEDVGKRFEAYGWHVVTVADGNDVDAVDSAIALAKAALDRPSLVVVNTVIGFGSPKKAGSADSHGSPLGKDEVLATKRALGWPEAPAFHVPDEASTHFRQALVRGAAAQGAWQARWDEWATANPHLAREWVDGLANALPSGWDRDVPAFGPADAAATRATSGQVLNAIARNVPSLVGGSADLNPSTNTALKGMGDFESPSVGCGDAEGAVGGGWSYAGRNHHYGVREHAMAAAANGMAQHGGLRPYVATFFNFVDYLKPALRLSALMHQPVIYVFTHDSIALGEDGPTHQPIEQLASLRATPGIAVLRPADANETAVAWKVAVETTTGPTALVLTRQKVSVLGADGAEYSEGLRRGAYTLQEAEGGTPQVVLIGTGSEVWLCVEAAKLLKEQGVRPRVVSLPSWELFDAQPVGYRESVLPPGTPKLAVEAGATIGWHRYVGDKGDVIGLDRFGASAPAERLLAEFGFTPQNVAERARALLR
ncbi:MAG TPA: transketolase [Chthonomonadales bacterium]|nr:transketolase [Chthonomonadales bacterium]